MSLALCITAVTYLLLGRGYIIFGALHMIGLSLLLAYPFLRLGRKNFIFGSILIILGWYVQDISVEHYWLLWLGLAPPDFYSLDYIPMLPWFGVVLYGVGLGGLLYPGYRRRMNLPDRLSAQAAFGQAALLSGKKFSGDLSGPPAADNNAYDCSRCAIARILER